jgi:hypothetical protein
MDKEMNNLKELGNFINSLKNTTQLSNGDLTINAKVNYKWNSNQREQTENLEVKIIQSGYKSGKISLNEGEYLTVDDVHLDFDPQYQDYKFQKGEGLTISGNSGKAGRYKVLIQEI